MTRQAPNNECDDSSIRKMPINGTCNTLLIHWTRTARHAISKYAFLKFLSNQVTLFTNKPRVYTVVAAASWAALASRQGSVGVCYLGDQPPTKPTIPINNAITLQIRLHVITFRWNSNEAKPDISSSTEQWHNTPNDRHTLNPTRDQPARKWGTRQFQLPLQLDVSNYTCTFLESRHVNSPDRRI